MSKYFITADGTHIDVRELTTTQLHNKLARIEQVLKDPEVLFAAADTEGLYFGRPTPETKEWYKRLRGALRKELRRRKEIQEHLLGDL